MIKYNQSLLICCFLFIMTEHLKQGFAAFELYYRELCKDFELRIKEAETSLEVALAELTNKHLMSVFILIATHAPITAHQSLLICCFLFIMTEHLKQGLAAFELYYRELRKDFELRIKEAETSLEVALAELQMTTSLEDSANIAGK